MQFQQDNQGQVIVTGTAACTGGPILIGNLTTVSVSGGTDNQRVNLMMSTTGLCGGVTCVPPGAIKKASWGKVNWTISLGTDLGAPTPQDALFIYQAGLARTDALDLVMGANGIDLSNDGDLDVTVAGIENFKVQSDSTGEDVISAGGSTHRGRVRATGRGFRDPPIGVLGAGYGIVASNDVNCLGLVPPEASTCGDKTLTGGAGADRIQAVGASPTATKR